MRNIAIIPARSGSKGLKDKNIKLLNGKPLIAYTIEAALSSCIFEDVVVTTDSEDYAKIVKKYGATVPFIRDEKLSGDTVTSYDVVVDVFNKLKEKKYDNLMLLQPTSPLRSSEDIKNAMQLFLDKKANAVVSLCEVDHSPIFTGMISEDLNIDGFIKKGTSYRRQDLPRYYRINGAIYLANIDYYIENTDLYRQNCYAYIMKKENSVDIDDKLDFIFAETLLKNKERI
ncbi:MAG: CMP-N-acetlyneuraminic acid synthetase [Firmicutes bacterium HGW-Firmicutes-4]|nr:MAG: CMP-N-acetlyneuraminic acid synthetase [Firmicutes bacterium HGW-Firmicutes-4]